MLRDSPIEVVRTLAVHPEWDVFASHIFVAGLENPASVYWSANLAPCTRKYLELPLADWYDDRLNGFAAFAREDGNEVVHFRPKSPGALDWARAEATLEDWGAFGAGVWIAIGKPQEVEGFRVGSRFAGPSAELPVGREGRRSAVGEPFSVQRIVLEPEEDGQHAARIFVAIDDTLVGATTLLQQTRLRGYGAFMEDVLLNEGDSLGDLDALHTSDGDVKALMERLRALLPVMQDRKSGAVVRSPAAQPPLARDWPRDAFWRTYALDLAGFREAAEHHCLFLAQSVRRVYRRGMPVGSLPATLYADGQPASPHVVLDVEAPSGMIKAMLFHGSLLPDEERRVFLEKVWPAVALSGDFLASWMDARDGRPLHSFDVSGLGDVQSFGLLVATRAGIGQALEIADLAEEDAPESWIRRKRQLDVLLVNHLGSLDEPWPADIISLSSIADAIPVDDPAFEEAVAASLDALADMEGVQAARVLGGLAMLYRRVPAQLSRLEPYVLGVLRSVLRGDPPGTAFPDGLAMAMAYVAASLVNSAAN
jgi:hypothetical protein